MNGVQNDCIYLFSLMNTIFEFFFPNLHIYDIVYLYNVRIQLQFIAYPDFIQFFFFSSFLNRVQRFSHTIHIKYAGKKNAHKYVNKIYYICIVWIRPSLKSKMIFISHSVLKLIYYVLSLQNNPFVMAFPFNLCSNVQQSKEETKTFKYMDIQFNFE